MRYCESPGCLRPANWVADGQDTLGRPLRAASCDGHKELREWKVKLLLEGDPLWIELPKGK